MPTHARIAYTDAAPNFQQQFGAQKAEWMKSITELYKYRHNNSDAGLKEMIGGIRAKPLPAGAGGTTPATP